MHSTGSVLKFVIIMTTIVAFLLALLQNGLKTKHEANEAIYSKKATLGAIADHLGIDYGSITDEQVESIFANSIEQVVINQEGKVFSSDEIEAMGYKGGTATSVDMAKEHKKGDDKMLPLYVYTKDDGKKYYILYSRGKGLWDEIWGCVALEDDFNTIAGVSFDHKAETPGLGAEIKDNKAWVKQFIGKKIYDGDMFKSVDVRKGGAKDPVYEVDGISGATITGDGVADMLEDYLVDYQPYLNEIKG